MHTVTFDQMERSTERTMALVLWAKHAKNWAVAVLSLAVLNAALHSLLNSVSGEKVNSLTDVQANELASMLKGLIQQLKGGIIDHNYTCFLRRKPVFSGLFDKLEINTEDLCDIVEDLILSSNSEFRGLVADSVKSISSVHSAELVGRM